MTDDCDDELYFLTQIYFINVTDLSFFSLISFLSEQADASDQCRDSLCGTMKKLGFPCPSSQGKTLKNKSVATDAVESMPTMCKWQMFLSSQFCVADKMDQDLDIFLSCMERKFSEDCHDVICGVMDDTGAPCPETPVGNIDISIKHL